MKKLNKFLGLLLLLAMGVTSIGTLPVHAEGESTPKEGFSFTENTTHPEWDADYLATFVYRNTDESKTVKSVSLAGGFQFYDPAEVHDYKGFADNSFIPCYDAFQYRKGMHPASGSTQKDVSKDGQIRYPMTEVEENVYEVTLPLPANQYYYAYYVTYEGTDEEVKINDPANLPVKAPSGSDAGWSLALVGDSAHAPEGQQYIYPDAVNKGTVKNVQYTAADGTTQWLEVYLPYGYSMDTKYKTVYVSHGGGGNEDEWMTIGSMKNMMDNMIEQGVTEPAIVVTMNNSVIKDWDLRTKNIAENIVPFVEAYFSSSPKAEDRAFCGLSMGGRVTSEVMKAHPDMFRYFGMFSGGIPDNDINNYNVEEMKKDTFYLTAGNVDMAYSNGGGWDIEKLAGMLDSFGVKYTLDRPYGGHDWYVWRASYTKFATDYLWKNSSEKDYEPGVAVSENKNPAYSAPYQAEFTMDSNSLDEKVTNVQLVGNFQFLKEEDAHLYKEQGGKNDNMTWYSAYEYQNGMFPTGACGNTDREDLNYYKKLITYDMENDGGVYTVTLPLPATEYYYGYLLTYEDGSQKTVWDPANAPVVNEANGHDPTWSYVFVGDSRTALKEQEAIYSCEKAGTWSFVTYPASDGTEQPLGIYLPYGYDSSRKYKTLYLSHGGGGNETEWFQLGAAANIFDNLTAEGKVEPTVIVAMDNSHWNGGITAESNETVANEVADYIIPFMEKNYSVSDKPSDRAYAGLSAGGVATAVVLQYRPEIMDYYGIISACAIRKEIPSSIMDAMKEKHIFVGAGNVDFGLTGTPLSTDSILNFFDENKISYDFRTFNGSHDWNTWRAALTTFAEDYLWKVDKADDKDSDTKPVVKPDESKKDNTPALNSQNTNKKNNASAKTGDTTNVMFYAGTLLVGLAAVALAVALRKRHS